jgi:hypothetical protein
MKHQFRVSVTNGDTFIVTSDSIINAAKAALRAMNVKYDVGHSYQVAAIVQID